MEIKEVLTAKDLSAFIRFPLDLYRGSPYYVPPLTGDESALLRRDRNPAFTCCQARYWLAYQDRRVVGRVAAILNRSHIQHWNQPYLRFGWLDFNDDRQVVAGLLGKVENWARELDLTAVHGPLGFSDMDRQGMLVEGFDRLGTMATSYNYAYYPGHLEALGYRKDTDWVEYEIDVPPTPDERLAKAAEIVLKRSGLHLFAPKHKREMLAYAGQLFELLCEEYQHLYGFVPFSPAQVDGFVKQYFGYLSPDFVPIVLDANDRMVAFGITLPSLSRALQKANGRLLPFGFLHLWLALRKNTRADLYLVAVKSEYQGRGVNAVLIDRMNRVFNRLGVTVVESNPELETNTRVQAQWKFFERKLIKRRRCFIKEMEPP